MAALARTVLAGALAAGVVLAPMPALATESLSRAKAGQIADGCSVYYAEGARIRLATGAKDDDCWDSSMVSKQDRTFLGWSLERIPDIVSGAQYDAAKAKIMPEVTMKEPGVTVYAVWAAQPVLDYDVNPPQGVKTPPETPRSVTGDFGAPVADGSGWTTGDGGLIPGWTFEGWTDTKDGTDLHDWTRPLTELHTTVHARWRANEYVVRFDPNADDTTGHMDDQHFQYDQAQDLTGNAFSRSGWKFTGWNTRPDGQGDAYEDRQQVTNLTARDGGVVTLYAQWEDLRLGVLPFTGGKAGPWPWIAGIGLVLVLAAAGIGARAIRRRRK